MPHMSDSMWYLSSSIWMTSLSLIICRSIHVAANGTVALFSRAEQYSIVYPFICWWTFRLAIVKSAAVNTGCVHLLELEFCLDIYPGVGLLDHMTTLFFVFWGTSILLSIVAVSIYVLPTVHNSSLFYTSLQMLVNYLWSFWSQPFWQVWGDIIVVGN